MKKYLTIAAMMACALSLPARETVTEAVAVEEEIPSPGKCNWFISAGAGPQVFFGDHDRQRRFGERISPALDIAVGKWITPGIGMRLMYSGLYAKGATQNGVFQSGGPIKGKPWSGYWLNESKFNFMNLHADVMFDLCNLIDGYKESRIYSCTPYVGVGLAYVYDKPHKKSITGNLGILNSFHISKAFDINADIQATVFNDNFDGQSGHRKFEGMLSLTVGITYKFDPRGWKTKKEVVTVYETVYDNAAINELRAQVNELVKKNE